MYKIIIRESIGFDFCNYMNIRKLNNILDYYWKLLFYPQYDYILILILILLTISKCL